MIRPRVVISTFGSLGDLNPYVAIALELRHRGYEPVIATSPLYREKITSLGLLFHPVRPDLPSYDRPEEPIASREYGFIRSILLAAELRQILAGTQAQRIREYASETTQNRQFRRRSCGLRDSRNLQRVFDNPVI